MIPEFVGRIPVVGNLHELDHDALVRILTEPKNCLVRQYQTILSFEGVELSFTPDALDAVAEEAITRKVGARGLRIILEELMLDIMYQVPSNPELEELVITNDTLERFVQENGGAAWSSPILKPTFPMLGGACAMIRATRLRPCAWSTTRPRPA